MTNAEESDLDHPVSGPLNATVGFVSGRSAFVAADGVWVDAGLARVIEPLADRCRETRVALSCWGKRRPLDDFRLRIALSKLHRLPFMPSFARSLLAWRECRARLRDLESRCDVLVVQLPFTAPLALLSLDCPVVYHVCADPLAFVRASNYWRGWRRLPALVSAFAVDAIQRRLVKSPVARTVTNGEVLLETMAPRVGRSVVSTALSERDLTSVTRQRSEDGRFRLLFVGYLRPEKGFDILVQALSSLVETDRAIELVVVGADPIVARSLGDLDGLIADLVRRGQLTFRGALPFGERLFQEYADADLLVLPSRSEGTPRVLVEARAFGCPVLATRVGGIPSSVRDGEDGLLVPSEDPTALVEAVRRVRADPALRSRLAEAGRRRAREWTAERFADLLVSEVAAVAAEARVGSSVDEGR